MAELVDCVSVPYREAMEVGVPHAGQNLASSPSNAAEHLRQTAVIEPAGIEHRAIIHTRHSLYRMSPDYRVIIGDSRRMSEVADESVHLTVTSPPYPMVSIWDDFFAEASAPSYNDMHEYLNETWREIRRVLVPGGIACINVGDATRTSNGIFHLYPNHSRIIENFEKLGFVTLPYVLWKKPTNRPHYKGKGAFLGSGFLPPNAYVTLDMEYILIFRKGPPRSFPPKDPRRYDSKFTKKERDEWFSQVWRVPGARQDLDGFARRVAAFPEEIPRRLIRMFSILGDWILDPFLGSGTTLKVAMDLDRKFVGYERLPQLTDIIRQKVASNHRQVEFLEPDRVIKQIVVSRENIEKIQARKHESIVNTHDV